MKKTLKIFLSLASMLVLSSVANASVSFVVEGTLTSRFGALQSYIVTGNGNVFKLVGKVTRSCRAGKYEVVNFATDGNNYSLIKIIECHSGPVIVSSFRTGSFSMAQMPNPTPGYCGKGIKLILDEGKIKGELAFLENFVVGFCKFYIFPYPRYFSIKLVNVSCGSKYYAGTRYDRNGAVKIEVIDHRTRICDDIVAARVIMTETEVNGQKEVYYSQK